MYKVRLNYGVFCETVNFKVVTVAATILAEDVTGSGSKGLSI